MGEVDRCPRRNQGLTVPSLLYHPFDYSAAFDQALKNVIKTLPNRPPKETSDDAVSAHLDDLLQTFSKERPDILLRIYR